jgi:hypothetical protein
MNEDGLVPLPILAPGEKWSFPANIRIRIPGERLSDAELEAMDYNSLRWELCLGYIPCSDVRTKKELLQIHRRDFALDKTRLPLYNRRTGNDGTDGHLNDGRMGLVACANRAPSCFKVEDGFTAFNIVCTNCSSPMYCSEACREEHWTREHKDQCAQMRRMNEQSREDESRVKDKLLDVMRSLNAVIADSRDTSGNITQVTRL